MGRNQGGAVALSAKKKTKRKPKPQPRPLTKEEATRLIMAAASDPDHGTRIRDQALIRLMLTGLRIGEVQRLTIRDLYVSTEPYHIFVTGKGDKDRRVPLSPETVTAVRRQIEVADGILRDTGWVFPGRFEGEHITSRPIQRMIKDRARAARFPDWQQITPHDLRHTFSVQCHIGGMNDKTLQDLLGHASIRTTQKYLLLSGKDHDTEINRIGGLPF